MLKFIGKSIALRRFPHGWWLEKVECDKRCSNRWPMLHAHFTENRIQKRAWCHTISIIGGMQARHCIAQRQTFLSRRKTTNVSGKTGSFEQRLQWTHRIIAAKRVGIRRAQFKSLLEPANYICVQEHSPRIQKKWNLCKRANRWNGINTQNKYQINEIHVHKSFASTRTNLASRFYSRTAEYFANTLTFNNGKC